MKEYNEIVDIQSYNVSMGRPIMDKLFFVDKVNADVIVDYGSADGCLIEHLLPWYPNAKFIGYDNNVEMNKLAKNRCGERAQFFDNWEDVESNCTGNTAVVLSSVIHEVYHYSQAKEIDTFWDRIFKFNSIVIRDMVPSRSIDRQADINDIAKVYRKFLHTFALKDFETNFGSIESNRNLIHFLLKYRYTQPNWAREVKENYLPLYREELLAKLPNEHEIIYHEHYVLPFLRQRVMADFNIDLKDSTHLKIILQKT